MSKARQFTPTPAQSKFIYSNSTYNLLMSSRGEGKSTSAVIAILVHAKRTPPENLPVKWAVVRDTRRNLGLSTVQTIKEWLPEQVASFWRGKEDEPEACKIVLNGQELADLHFFGCDSAKDLSYFQSFECDGVWIEEPAPAADISGGVSGDVLAIAGTSIRRTSIPRVQVTMNPPHGDHWTAQIWGLPGATEPDWTPDEQEAVGRIRANSTVVVIPPGENIYLDQRSPGYRERNRDVLIAMGRSDLVNRLVHGKVGNVQVGEPVVPEFSSDYVVSACPPAKPGDKLLLGWDFWHHPAVTIFRPVPGGYLDVLGAFQGNNVGVRQMLDRDIMPWFASNIPEGVSWQHTGDPSGLTGDQSNSHQSAVKVVIEKLPGQFIPGPVSVDDRRNPVHDVMNRMVMGRPWVRIDERYSAPLVKALEGGWHYPKDASGTVVKERWAKNLSSNVGESFAYGCALLTRRDETVSSLERHRRKLAQTRRGRSGVGNRTGA